MKTARRMRSPAAGMIIVALVAACAGAPPLTPFSTGDEEAPERGFAVLVGARDLEAESDFGSTDEQPLGGAELHWARPGAPLALELGLSYSTDADEPSLAPELETEGADLGLGLRYRFTDLGVFHPYLAGGLALLYGRTESVGPGFPTTEDTDWDGGVYAHGGVWAPFGDDLRLGLDLRWVGSDWIESDGLDLDHTAIALTFGTGF
jgi:hypothetical protein